jgi:TonB-dependent receptor
MPRLSVHHAVRLALFGMGSLLASAAQSQEALEEISVVASPIRDAQAEAIQLQRAADNLVNVIAADTVGRFPDQNSAAAVARLPAVAVQRDQGQERYIQVRGAPNRWTSVSIDGITVVSADEGGNERAFRFDAVPAIMLSAIEVNKSLTADLSAEAIVARVNLATYSPFSQAGISAQGDLARGEMELGGGVQQQGALRLGYSNEAWGFVVGASHYGREQVTDNREFTYKPDNTPATIDIRNYLLERESNGATLGFAFRPAQGHELTAKYIYSDFNDDEQRNQYVFQMPATGSSRPLGGTQTDGAGDLVGVSVRGTFNLGNYRTRNKLALLGGEHELGRWNASWKLAQVDTINATYLPLVLQNMTSATARPSLTYDLSQPNFPVLSLYTTVAGATPGTFARGTALTDFPQANYGLNLLLPLRSVVNSDGTTAKLDLKRDLDWSGTTGSLTFGVASEERRIDGSLLSSAVPTINVTSVVPAANYITNKPWVSGFPRGFGLNYVDNVKMRADLDAHLAALQRAGSYNPDSYIVPTNRYDITETVNSAYASLKLQRGKLQAVAGLRLEDVDLDVKGFVTPAANTFVASSTNSGYSDFYPSLNLKYDLTDSVVLRAAAQRGIARPSFGVVRTGASISDVNLTITGGNPDVKPERTTGGDVSVEWYLAEGALASVGAFYRSVDDVLYDSTKLVTDERFNLGGVDRRGYRYNTTLNGRDGHLQGLELAYLHQWTFLPSPFDGLGFQGNLALLDGEFKTLDGVTNAFPGTSDTIVNASVFYEKYGWSVRLSYQWRDDWAETISLTGLDNEFRQGYENLDLSVRYQVNDRLGLYFDASNLTDETYVVFQGTPKLPTEVEQIGRRFMVGIRARL